MECNFFHEFFLAIPAKIRCAVNHRRLGRSRKPKLLVLSSWGTGTWIQLLYFIAFSARVRLLHARPVLQSDFNASLIISDLRSAPLCSTWTGQTVATVTYVWGNLVTNLISKYRFLPVSRLDRSSSAVSRCLPRGGDRVPRLGIRSMRD